MFVCAGVHSIPMFLLALNSVSTHFLSNGSGSVAGKYVCVESILAVVAGKSHCKYVCVQSI